MMLAYDDTWKEMPCELWSGLLMSNGYGFVRDVRVGGKKLRVMAHQMTWEECFGDILVQGDVIGHKCDVKHCRQPLHLFKTTHAGNMDDMKQKGRHSRFGATECRHGHPYVLGSFLTTANGSRTCRICRRKTQRDYLIRRSER